jgi:hypothetical protein
MGLRVADMTEKQILHARDRAKQNYYRRIAAMSEEELIAFRAMTSLRSMAWQRTHREQTKRTIERRFRDPEKRESRRAGWRKRASRWRANTPDYSAKRHIDPVKHYAHHMVYKAVKSGRLQRGPCQRCGTPEHTQGHHYLGYATEHLLDVIWLCAIHHREAHREGGEAS